MVVVSLGSPRGLAMVLGRQHELQSDVLAAQTSVSVATHRAAMASSQRTPVSTEVSGEASARSNLDRMLFRRQGDKELMRGTTMSEVLKRWCRVMGSQECAGEYWGYSEPVDRFDTFISHNWSVSRLDKCLVLLFHSNAWRSTALAMIMSMFCCILVIAGLLPIANRESNTTSISFWCLLSHSIVFFMSLICSQEVVRLFGFRGSTCFLDKCCVNQKDAEKKQRAIESLAAYVYYSQNVLVIYTEAYLKRLWTMYEIASFLLIHPGGQAHVAPVALYKLLAVVIAMIYVQFFALSASMHPAVQQILPGYWVYCALGMVASVVFMIQLPLIYLLAGEMARLSSNIRSFEMAGAQCYSEDDRALVISNIIRFLKSFDYVSEDASDEDAIARLEDIVHTEMPSLLQASLGPVAVPYSTTLLAAGAVWGYMLDRIAAEVADGTMTWSMLLSDLLHYGEIAFCNIPLTFVLAISLGRSGYALTRARKWRAFWFWPLAYTTLVAFNGVMNSLTTVLQIIVEKTKNPVWHVAQALLLVVELGIVYYFFRVSRWKHD